ncbi:MAG TPA: Trm112 family protein [Candidatus Methanomethylicus sp.]|nr:Trm112 family protein [Candidatus Methanomethylicus sp.]
MKRRLMDILACPICKSHPLELLVFAEKEEIDEGVLLCSGCGRWYPIIETIPHMLPDDLRDANEDRGFLERWRAVMPEVVLKSGKPFSLG